MRVKRGVSHVRRRERLLKRVKGYRWRRKSSIRLGRVAFLKAGVHAYRDRKRKKRDFRRLWQIRINAAAREHGMSYSVFMGKLKKAGISLNRKILSELAEKHPTLFAEVVKKIQ